MNYTIEFIYLFLALIFLLLLSFNLTVQILTIYTSQSKIQKDFFDYNISLNKRNIDIKETSYLLIKKSQWIEAIQALKLTFLEQQIDIDCENYSKFQSLQILYSIYSQLQEVNIARYYNKLLLLSRDSRI